MEATISPRTSVDKVIPSDGRWPSSESTASGVTWTAVLAGAAVSASLGLILLALGTGLGMSSVSLWSNAGVSAGSMSKAAVVWLILMQVMSSSMGGYIAGRLRTKWTAIHTDEIYFRDTAHGFLAWSVSLVVTAAFLATAAASLMGSAEFQNPNSGKGGDQYVPSYFVDELFRTPDPKPEAVTSSGIEAGTIFAHALKAGDLSAADQQYLGRLIAARTGLSQAEADSRVTEVFNDARKSAESARKTAAHSLLWLFAALLVGAFCASFAATIGGSQRDNVISA